MTSAKRGSHSSNPKSSRNIILALAVIALGGGVMFRASIQAQSSVIASHQAIIMADPIGPFRRGPKINEKPLATDINNLINNYPELDVAVVYKDLTSGKFYNYGAVDKPFIAASVSKLITASMYLHEVDSGKRSLNDTVGGSTARAQLKLLIEQSDNVAWLLLDEALGYNNLDIYAKSIGMTQYKHSTTSLTAKDIATLLQKLYTGKLLSKTSTDQLLGHMLVANYRGYIVAALPAGFKSYHKVGLLPDRIHDTAIVDNGKYPYILVIFTQAKPGNSYSGSARLLQSITKLINAPYILKTN